MTSTPKTVCLLSHTLISSDPRVRRQGDAFHAAGWQVYSAGKAESGDNLPVWMREAERRSGAAAPAGKAHIPVRRRLRQKVEKDYPVVYRALLPSVDMAYRVYRWSQYAAARLNDKYALRLHWGNPLFQDIYRRARKHKADIWLANDWDMLPIAARLAEERGGAIVYDTHEFATEQYPYNKVWRFRTRPIIKIIERDFIPKAAVVSTVSSGIADELLSLYGIERPLVIRNTPVYQESAFRETGRPIRVLYHGIVAPTRRMEETIDSVKQWRPEFTLTIRGPGQPEYLKSLNARIIENGLQDRVFLVPPVPMTELVAEASKFDVGIFAFGGPSAQNKYVLPNKLFEYIMAGLSVCVSDLPEMARIVSENGIGELVRGYSPDEIARSINKLDAEIIDRHKKNSLKLARDLSWEVEAQRFVEACAGVAGDGR